MDDFDPQAGVKRSIRLGELMACLANGDFPVSDWDDRFIGDVCRKGPTDTTPRQRAMIEILAWRYRAHLPAHLVPTSEPPKLKAHRA